MEANQAASVRVNPLSQPVEAQVQTELVTLKPTKFSFRSVEVTDETGAPKKDEAGKVVKWKRPTLELKIPLLTVSGLIAALQSGDKSTELALEQANSAIIDRVRGLIGKEIETNPKVELTSESVDITKLSFLEIANLPRGERGAGISKEDWEAFVEDYKATMATAEAIAAFPDKKPRSADVLDKHGVLLMGKFNQVRSRKDVVEQMLTFLDVWVIASKNADEHQACYELLQNKGKAIMQGEDFNNL